VVGLFVFIASSASTTPTRSLPAFASISGLEEWLWDSWPIAMSGYPGGLEWKERLGADRSQQRGMPLGIGADPSPAPGGLSSHSLIFGGRTPRKILARATKIMTSRGDVIR
jgi:hypothetical protein